MDNQVCCAHSKVILKHHDYPDGTRSDYWECDSGCGIKFVPVPQNAQRMNEINHKLNEALEYIGRRFDRAIKKLGEQLRHTCCNGECNHDDCCAKVEENCPNYKRS